MSRSISINIIAHIYNDFDEKFGIPRQSGLAPSARSKIIFEPEYRSPDALRGMDGYSHLWLLWQFDKAAKNKWQPTVRPPRLGGNVRMGVFATRSPYRPNPLGLSLVKLDKIETSSSCGPVLHVSGADIMNGTPIFDIKPYLAYADSVPGAISGFAPDPSKITVDVDFPQNLAALFPKEKLCALTEILAQDPRPGYQHEPERIYKLSYAGYDIHFCTDGKILHVTSVIKL